MNSEKIIKINKDFIKLGQVLKLSNIVSSGSDAKFYISQGFVYLNDIVVYERGKKVYNDDIVKIKLEKDLINIKIQKDNI